MLKIHCPDAYSINLIYDHYRLGEGSKFFIYNEDRTMILGAFTIIQTTNLPTITKPYCGFFGRNEK